MHFKVSIRSFISLACVLASTLVHADESFDFIGTFSTETTTTGYSAWLLVVDDTSYKMVMREEARYLDIAMTSIGPELFIGEKYGVRGERGTSEEDGRDILLVDSIKYLGQPRSAADPNRQLYVPLGFTIQPDPGVETANKPNQEEAPFFRADKNGSGPLTLDELQINIPKDIDVWMSDRHRACFFDAVERRAQEAGDPADLDPDAFPYWGGKTDRESWSRHNHYMQRVLLAQAIISFAMSDC